MSRAFTRLSSMTRHLSQNRNPVRQISNSGPAKFAPSPIPEAKGKIIRTAAALIIGDEILNGKVADANSHYFAKYCFDHGIDLKRVEVVPDVEGEIVEATRRMVHKYDFVITTGGVGPTHDDITYASLAAAFQQNLVHNKETLERMSVLSTSMPKPGDPPQTAAQKQARERMALFPANAEVLFTREDLWVPVVRLEGKLCVFPGIPFLFQALLDGLTPYLSLPPPSERPYRQRVFTRLPEPSIAPYLTSLQDRVSSIGVQVGSYPRLKWGTTVTLIGPELLVKELGVEVEREIQGIVLGLSEPEPEETDE